ncbi:MAG: hypothetical protein LBG92_00345 [Prevotellaceae bacterium]|nr:hypothetical protein [Prevotellaceae bacterium]
MSRKAGLKKTGGRTKGTSNRITSELKQFIETLIEKNMPVIQRDLSVLF